MGIIDNLFGSEETGGTKTVRLRCLRSVFERQTIREGAPEYLATTKFTSPAQVFEIFRDLAHEPKEHFLALHLDGKNRIICFERVSVGSLNQSIVHPREVFKGALLSSAAVIILIHNHPSGDPTPSREDIEVTRRLKDGGELLGIKVLDHIIIGDRYLSFTEMGLL
jgi:DNA repair protein RadC